MSTNVNREVQHKEQIVSFLVENYGILHQYAQHIANENEDIIDKGKQLQSFIYYVAEEIISEEEKKHPNNTIPVEWLDPNFNTDELLEDNE